MAEVLKPLGFKAQFRACRGTSSEIPLPGTSKESCESEKAASLRLQYHNFFDILN